MSETQGRREEVADLEAYIAGLPEGEEYLGALIGGEEDSR